MLDDTTVFTDCIIKRLSAKLCLSCTANNVQSSPEESFRLLLQCE